MSQMKRKKNNKSLLIVSVITAVLFIVALVLVIITFVTNKKVSGNEAASLSSVSNEPVSFTQIEEASLTDKETTTTAETTQQSTAQSTTAVPKTTVAQTEAVVEGATIAFPSDTSSWQMICLNLNHRISSNVENELNLSYVAGSGERMDSRAAAAYEQMYSAAANDGIYLTPCSGYRSYSTQKRLFNEFLNDYLNSGYSRSEAEALTSKRRMPPGSSEHNIGICMDIICADSSLNFQNTQAYAWLSANADEYGFILRYPENKVSVTGVKFEPWHWRYVGVGNASAIKNSGLCLEEYLGVS